MSETIAIIDYGSGNLRSAERAVTRAASDRDIPARALVTTDPEQVARADRLILPGVGAFADCMAGLDAITGMREAMTEAVHRRGRPFLGICVGMQLLAERGLEYGVTEGLGWIPGEVSGLPNPDGSLKIPHMGWNTLTLKTPGHPVLDGLAHGDHAYFVHSYRFNCADAGDVLAETHYGEPVAAVIGRDTIVGTQFHPEKSQRTGLRFLANFLTWSP